MLDDGRPSSDQVDQNWRKGGEEEFTDENRQQSNRHNFVFVLYCTYCIVGLIVCPFSILFLYCIFLLGY